ncbi:hypothetical protein P9W99_18470 [Bacillus cereus]|uniref:Uncharacterized protein n=1 Tax=Bacillus cereus ISP2954 TaxID=1053215 RepID=A0A9W5VHT5_BACCE|nr:MULTISPECIES: hypothetical protein [Bacillus cereus group]AGE75840.1 hypothetical protein HD73_0255 [Bacillus thuringiensis serovar kurstaki str. HD73]AHZ49093.1 hypothetical protein YBT1520_01600 [Bacillus thuringiensis serovar kurstaki str. YBT-1520]AIE31422.1 hypothetical protein BTK_01450 [Bacillus thuringiensis serovar kurstaki str. HD-1]AJA17565.1 hypothetical protein BT4G5_01045 [Bacillus thuringiensis serovar galleriae]AJK43349.1 hypothetical protein BG08_5794 [Bacillus thuringiensi
MKETKYFVLHNRGYGLNAYECESKIEASRMIKGLIEDGEPASSIILTQQVALKTKIQSVIVEIDD